MVPRSITQLTKSYSCSENDQTSVFANAILTFSNVTETVEQFTTQFSFKLLEENLHTSGSVGTSRFHLLCFKASGNIGPVKIHMRSHTMQSLHTHQ